jgi:hypothetical protein
MPGGTMFEGTMEEFRERLKRDSAGESTQGVPGGD